MIDLAISRRDATEIERRYNTPPDRLSLVYNGVNLDRFHPDHRQREGVRMEGQALVAETKFGIELHRLQVALPRILEIALGLGLHGC